MLLAQEERIENTQKLWIHTLVQSILPFNDLKIVSIRDEGALTHEFTTTHLNLISVELTIKEIVLDITILADLMEEGISIKVLSRIGPLEMQINLNPNVWKVWA